MTGRPVKLVLSREETFLVTGNRPPSNMKLKAGVKKDGTLTALQFTLLGTGGAYESGGIALTDWLIRDLYTCPNVKCESTEVLINAGLACPLRAPGHPQGAWALEQMMDALAEKIGMDPVELRLKNVSTFSQARPGNPPYTSTGLKECLEQGAKAFGWTEALKRDRGAREGQPDSLRRRHGSVSLVRRRGRTAFHHCAEALCGRKRESQYGRQRPRHGHQDRDGNGGFRRARDQARQDSDRVCGYRRHPVRHPQRRQQDGSTESPAVRAAAIDVKRQLFQIAAEELKVPASDLALRNGEIIPNADQSKKVKLNKLEALKKRGMIVGVGYRGPNPEGKSVNPFGAQFCEVKVDTRTGEIHIVRFVAAHDSGRVMNRLTYNNQVIGGITMGIGLAMTEMRVLDQNQTGKVVSKNWHDYKLPTALDVPREIVVVPVDPDDTEANSNWSQRSG